MSVQNTGQSMSRHAKYSGSFSHGKSSFQAAFPDAYSRMGRILRRHPLRFFVDLVILPRSDGGGSDSRSETVRSEAGQIHFGGAVERQLG